MLRPCRAWVLVPVVVVTLLFFRKVLCVVVHFPTLGLCSLGGSSVGVMLHTFHVKPVWGQQLQRPSTHTLVKPKQKARKCLAPPQNVTVAYLAYDARDEAVFKSALDAVNAGEPSCHLASAPCGPILPPMHMSALGSLSPVERQEIIQQFRECAGAKLAWAAL